MASTIQVRVEDDLKTQVVKQQHYFTHYNSETVLDRQISRLKLFYMLLFEAFENSGRQMFGYIGIYMSFWERIQ